MTFEELVGQKLVLGIEGREMDPQTIRLFQKTHAGGIILFQRNFESPEAILRLLTDLESALGRRLLVLLDHEGGRVIRFKDGVTFFPDAYAVGVTGDTNLARRQGEVEARELRALGIDLNLAPVLDVLSDSWNPVIGTRSYGEDPELVACMGKARIEGMQSKGLSACAKHYPGLGEVQCDPHQELPTVPRNLRQMKATCLVPFLKAIEVPVDSIMSSHAVFPEIDSKPATFSKRIIHDLLRLEFGYRGLLLTDDMIMGAVAKTIPMRQAAPRAAAAGHDLLLICSDEKKQLEAFDALVWAYKKKELSVSELEESVERIATLNLKRRERFLKNGNRLDDGKKIAWMIAKEGAEILNSGKDLLPLSSVWCSKHSVIALFPNLRQAPPECLIEPELLEPKDFLKRIFLQFNVNVATETFSLDLLPAEIEEIRSLAQKGDLILFFCWDAHVFSSERKLLAALQELGKRTVVLLLREPHDARWLRPETACVTGYGFRTFQIQAAIEKLFSPS